MKKIQTSWLVAGALVFALSHMTGSPVHAKESWPTRPIRFVVPYPPGGGADAVVRPLAVELGKQLGQNVIVENRPGGSSIIGTNAVAQAKPDGYTIGMITDSHAINPLFTESLPYDSVKDFEPVSQLVNVPFVLLVSPKLNASSMQQLVSEAQSRPGKINYASNGNTSPHFLATELLKIEAAIDLFHVPYSGGAPGLNALLANEVDVMLTGLSSGLPLVNSGQLVALAVTSPSRSSVAPNIPTVAETGYKDYSFVTWYGVVAPAGTQSEIVNRLSREIAIALSKPEMRDRLLSLGLEVQSSEPQEFAEHIARVTKQYKTLKERMGTTKP